MWGKVLLFSLIPPRCGSPEPWAIIKSDWGWHILGPLTDTPHSPQTAPAGWLICVAATPYFWLVFAPARLTCIPNQLEQDLGEAAGIRHDHGWQAAHLR